MKTTDYDKQSRPFRDFPGLGYTVIQPLPKLHGLPFTVLTLAYIHALRPSSIRVIPKTEGAQCDARNWRVTVWLDSSDYVRSIDQEVAIGLLEKEGPQNGFDLECALSDARKAEEKRAARVAADIGKPPNSNILQNPE